MKNETIVRWWLGEIFEELPEGIDREWFIAYVSAGFSEVKGMRPIMERVAGNWVDQLKKRAEVMARQAESLAAGES